MAIAYTWSIYSLDCNPDHEGHQNVVVTAHWRLNGVDGEHEALVYGSIGFEFDAEASFVPFADLTEETVIGWVKAAMGDEQVAAHEAAVAAQIEALVNPPVVTPDLPWGA